MTNLPDQSVTLVEVLERTCSFEEFSAVIETVVKRLKTEGISALITVQFYASPETTEVGAVLMFGDRDAMMEHINMISTWEEFKQLGTVIKPIEMRVYGKLTPEVEKCLRSMISISKHFKNHVAGFVR